MRHWWILYSLFRFQELINSQLSINKCQETATSHPWHQLNEDMQQLKKGRNMHVRWSIYYLLLKVNKEMRGYMFLRTLVAMHNKRQTPPHYNTPNRSLISGHEAFLQSGALICSRFQLNIQIHTHHNNIVITMRCPSTCVSCTLILLLASLRKFCQHCMLHTQTMLLIRQL